MFLDDLASICVTAGVGILGTTIFKSSAAQIPPGAGPYLVIVETGGTAPERTQNAVLTPAYQRPSAQLTVLATSYSAARAKAKMAYDALVGVRDTTVNGVWYREISPLQEPFDLGVDADARARVAFNVNGIKRPS